MTRQRSPIADRSKVAPWLYRLAVTQSLLYRRKQGRRRKLTDEYARRYRPSEEDSREVDPLAWLLAEERRRLIRTALGRLPSRDAEILLLKYTEDWSYHQLADHLGISQSAVQSRLHRARTRMRRELAALEVIKYFRLHFCTFDDRGSDSDIFVINGKEDIFQSQALTHLVWETINFDRSAFGSSILLAALFDNYKFHLLLQSSLNQSRSR